VSNVVALLKSFTANTVFAMGPHTGQELNVIPTAARSLRTGLINSLPIEYVREYKKLDLKVLGSLQY
jgi:hypothetical protein